MMNSNVVGGFLNRAEAMLKGMRGVKRAVGVRVRRLLPRWLYWYFVRRTFVRFGEAVREAMADTRPLPARYCTGFGTLIDPDKSSVQTIVLSHVTRQYLLTIIEASQGGELSIRDRCRTDIEIVRGVSSQLLYSPIWDWAIALNPQTGWYESGDILSAEYPDALQTIREYLERYRASLVNGGLIALLDAWLVVWESCKREKELVYLEKDIGRLMISWRRLARIYCLENPAHETHERRIAALLEKSRASRPSTQSPWRITSIY